MQGILFLYTLYIPVDNGTYNTMYYVVRSSYRLLLQPQAAVMWPVFVPLNTVAWGNVNCMIHQERLYKGHECIAVYLSFADRVPRPVFLLHVATANSQCISGDPCNHSAVPVECA